MVGVEQACSDRTALRQSSAYRWPSVSPRQYAAASHQNQTKDPCRPSLPLTRRFSTPQDPDALPKARPHCWGPMAWVGGRGWRTGLPFLPWQPPASPVSITAGRATGRSQAFTASENRHQLRNSGTTCLHFEVWLLVFTVLFLKCIKDV